MRFFFFLALWIFLSVMSVSAYAQSPALERIKKTGEIHCAVTEGGNSSVRGKIAMYYLQKVAEKNAYKIEFVKFPQDNGYRGLPNGGISDLVKRSVAEGKVDFVCDLSSGPTRDYRLQGPYQSYAQVGYLGHDMIGIPMCIECDNRPLYRPFGFLSREDDQELGDFINKTFSVNSDENAEIMEAVKLEHSYLFHGSRLFTSDEQRETLFYRCDSDSGILQFLKSLFPDRGREIICRK